MALNQEPVIIFKDRLWYPEKGVPSIKGGMEHSHSRAVEKSGSLIKYCSEDIKENIKIKTGGHRFACIWFKFQ